MGYVGFMAQDKDKGGAGSAGKSAADIRAEIRRERQAAELRANLQRRKQQVRARRGGAMDETDGLPASDGTKSQ
tara:strand:- start:322 stop:543 length:222 start_codon:yes stop_codon:yes gene_type:complete